MVVLAVAFFLVVSVVAKPLLFTTHYKATTRTTKTTPRTTENKTKQQTKQSNTKKHCSILNFGGLVQVPGSEPIHLDLEKLFLLSVSKENFDFRWKSEKNLPYKNFNFLKSSYFDLDAGFGSFPAVPREDFSRRIRICDQTCSMLASRGLNIGKAYPVKFQNIKKYCLFLVVSFCYFPSLL